MYHDIEAGAEFYLDESDYISDEDIGQKSRVVKTEAASASISISRSRTKPDVSTPLTPRGRKRPRRAANAIRSYAVPDSDEDLLFDYDSMEFNGLDHERRTKIEETSLQKWVKHLGCLMKEEQRKVLRHFLCSCSRSHAVFMQYQKQKKLMEMTSESGTKVCVAKVHNSRSLVVLSMLNNIHHRPNF
jgi:hypothetical protein